MGLDKKLSEKKLFVGLDIGQAADPSALVVLEKDDRLLEGADPFMSQAVGHYSIRHLQRWPLGTLYNKVTSDVVRLMNRPPLCPSPPHDPRGATLVVDNTGVGRPIVEDLRHALPGRSIVAVTISGGMMLKPHKVPGGWTVPKKDLAGVIQLCFGQNRLKAVKSKAMDQLVKELRTFTIKVKASTGNESYESLTAKDHDDVVLALAMPLWLAECGGGQVAPLRVIRLGGERKGKPLQIYVCNATDLADWTDDRRMLLYVFRDPLLAGEGVMYSEDLPTRSSDPGRNQLCPVPDGKGKGAAGEQAGIGVTEGVGEGDRICNSLPAGGMKASIHETGFGGPPPHALPNVLDTRVFRFLDGSPGDFQDGWEVPLEPWGRLPRHLLASPRDGKLLWSSIARRRDPFAECLIFCEEGEGDARAFSSALAVCDVLGLKREETLVRTQDREITVKKGDVSPSRHVYETVKAARSLVI